MLVEKRIEDDSKALFTTQRGVASAVGGHEGFGLAVVEHDTDVESAIGEADTDLGLLRGGLALEGLLLPEAGGRVELHPHRFAEHVAVDDWLATEALRLEVGAWSILGGDRGGC